MKTRQCPSCQTSMSYENDASFYRARKANSVCKSCSKKGELNPFYGKKHTEETKSVFSSKKLGSSNPMYGKSAMRGRRHREDTIQKMSSIRKQVWRERGANPTEYEVYRNKVDSLTRKQPIHLLENYNRRGVAGVENAYHLDHIKSVWWGFHNNIPPEQIADISNLRMIPWMENQTKWYK